MILENERWICQENDRYKIKALFWWSEYPFIEIKSPYGLQWAIPERYLYTCTQIATETSESLLRCNWRMHMIKYYVHDFVLVLLVPSITEGTHMSLCRVSYRIFHWGGGNITRQCYDKILLTLGGSGGMPPPAPRKFV